MTEAEQNIRLARVIRASVVSVAAVCVAAFSHVVAGGDAPGLFAFAGAILTALPLTLVLTHRRFGTVGTFTAIATTQALFHWMFVYLGVSSGRPGTPLPAHAEHFGMVQEFIPVVPNGMGPDIAMWCSHAVAAFITLWLIRHGDLALMRLGRRLSRAFWPAVSLHHSTPLRTQAQSFTQTRFLPLHSRRIAHVITHRGPPLRSQPQVFQPSLCV